MDAGGRWSSPRCATRGDLRWGRLNEWTLTAACGVREREPCIRGGLRSIRRCCGGCGDSLKWTPDLASIEGLRSPCKGLTPAKSLTLRPLVIPDEYFAEFFRGCIDGDGSVVVYGSVSHGQEAALRFTSGSVSRWCPPAVRFSSGRRTGSCGSPRSQTRSM